MGGESHDAKWYYSFLPNNMAGGSTSPLIPLFLKTTLGGTVAEVGLLSALSSIAAVPASILWGNLSDTTQRRRFFVLLGFGGMALTLMLMALSSTIGEYLLANVLFGLLATASAPVGTVLILESFAKDEWARRLGDFSRVGGIGWVSGLMLGSAWLLTFNGGDPSLPMRALFAVAALLSVASMILALRWVPEPEVKVERCDVNHGLSMHVHVFERARFLPQRVLHVLEVSSKNLKVKNFPANLRWYYATTFIFFAGFLSFYVVLPVYLSNYMSVAEVFVVYIASSGAAALTYSASGRWVTRWGGKRIQMISVLGRITLFPSFFLVTLLPLSGLSLVVAFCVLHALVGFCWANISVAGNALVSKMSYAEFRAESSGMYNATMGLGTIAGALLGGAVAQVFGYMTLFMISDVLLTVGLVILVRLNVEEEPAEVDSPHAVRA